MNPFHFSLPLLLFLVFYLLPFDVAALKPTVPVCDTSNSNNSQIYCSGPILDAVNYHVLFNDSKTYVDMPLKADPDTVQKAFAATFGTAASSQIDRTQLQNFINQYFDQPGTELIPCIPSDWQEKPPKLATIQDPQLREWAYKLNGIWKQLCRRIDPAIEAHSSRYSLLYVPHPFIVPGGRFREFYYWDAYWIIKGLIASEMYETAKNMTRNFAYIIERYGFVPNGGRVYYLQRSQPPFLSAMVYELYEATRDVKYVAEMLPTLVKELKFWDANRKTTVTVAGKQYEMYQYRTNSNVPRPESYRVDVQKSQQMDEEKKQQFYQDVASSAESGWDFSTRWFSDRKTIYTIETTNVIPVDLNALVCWNLDIIEYLYEKIGDTTNSELFRDRRAVFRKAVHSVFYNDTDGTWYDYNIRLKTQHNNFFTSTAVPLFTNCYNTLDTGKSQRVFDYMHSQGVFDFPSGIPSSMAKDSEEQWDFPNGWSPNNHMIIEGLRKSANPEMQDKGFEVASKWVMGNFKVYHETGHMWEKYNVIGTYAQPGSGGEYNVQDGFGWTNGVVLDLLLTYNDRLRVPSLAPTQPVPETSTKMTASNNYVLVSFCFFIYFLF